MLPLRKSQFGFGLAFSKVAYVVSCRQRLIHFWQFCNIDQQVVMSTVVSS